MSQTSHIVVSAAVGILLSAANIAAGLLVARRAQRLPVNRATALVLTAMTIRLVAMVVLIAVAVTLFDLHKLALALALMISFFVMVVLEAFFLHVRHEKAKAPLVKRRRYRRPRVPFTVW